MLGALELLFIWSAFKTNGTDVTFGERASLTATPFVGLGLLESEAREKVLAGMNINDPWTADTGLFSQRITELCRQF